MIFTGASLRISDGLVFRRPQCDQTRGKVHDQALPLKVDGVEPGFDKGNQYWFGITEGVGRRHRCITSGTGDTCYFQQGCCIRKSCSAVGSHVVFDARDLADEGGAVEELAAEQIPDEPCVGFERRKVGSEDEELATGEQFRGGDGVDTSELEDDATGVAAGWRPVRFECGLDRRCSAAGRKRDGSADREELRKIA